MKKNIGTPDRWVRALIGTILLIIAIIEKSWFLFIISLFIYFEAISSWCLFYQLIGKNTCSTKGKKK